MKKIIVTISSFFILMGSASSAQAFDFIGDLHHFLGHNRSWTEVIRVFRQWLPDYNRNVQDFYATHPESSWQDYR